MEIWYVHHCSPLLPSILPLVKGRLGVGRHERIEGKEWANVSPFGGQDYMGVVSRAGDGEEGGEDADKWKAVRSSRDKPNYIVAVPTAASGPVSLPSSGHPLTLAPVSPPHRATPRVLRKSQELKMPFTVQESGSQLLIWLVRILNQFPIHSTYRYQVLTPHTRGCAKARQPQGLGSPVGLSRLQSWYGLQKTMKNTSSIGKLPGSKWWLGRELWEHGPYVAVVN